MLHVDKILLASLLLQIFSRCLSEANTYEKELEQIHDQTPEEILSSTHLLISKAFGQEFMQQDRVVNLREVILNEVIL